MLEVYPRYWINAAAIATLAIQSEGPLVVEITYGGGARARFEDEAAGLILDALTIPRPAAGT